MRIDLRSGQALMPQQLLHRFQVGMIVQHGSSKGMPKHMRASFSSTLQLSTDSVSL